MDLEETETRNNVLAKASINLTNRRIFLKALALIPRIYHLTYSAFSPYCGLLGAYSVQFRRRISMFRRNILPPSTGPKCTVSKIIYADCDDGGHVMQQNKVAIGIRLANL
jgi:hypothetical protein